MEKYYQLFTVNVCTSEWAMEECIIGAEDLNDLVANLENIVTFNGGKRFDDDEVCKIVKEKDHRIFAIDCAYTTKPYTVLETFAYYE